MRRIRNTVVLGVVGLVGILALVGAAVLLLVDPNAHKARVEAAASQALGLEVGIAGRLTMHILPGLHMLLEDVQVRNRGVDVASAKEAAVDIDLMSLLGKDVQIHKIVLKHVVIAIERDRDGRFNFQKETTASESLLAREWPALTLSEAAITYTDQRFGNRFEASDCQVAVRDLRHAGGQPSSFFSGLAFTADLACRTARKDAVTVSDLKVTADAKAGIVELKPVTAHAFGAPGSGSVHADYTGPAPAYQIAYALPQFSIDEFLKAMSMKGVASGRMDLSANLSTQGHTVKDLLQTMKGKVSLRGKGLTFSGGDLDREFAEFESSQTFDLVDVGAVLLAGPLGLLVTKGYDFASISQGAPGSSEIRALVSDWTIERGVARAEDVAMATKENRVAMRFPGSE